MAKEGEIEVDNYCFLLYNKKMSSHSPRPKEIKYYEPVAGEKIEDSARNALAIARETQALTILTFGDEKINVFPDASVESILKTYEIHIAEKAKAVVDKDIPENKISVIKSEENERGLEDYKKHVEFIVNVNVKNISELLVWFEELYELQQKIHIKDNFMVQEVIKTLEDNGYVTGYALSITPQEALSSSKETRKWFIGRLMKTLQENGTLRRSNMNFLDEQRELLETE